MRIAGTICICTAIVLASSELRAADPPAPTLANVPYGPHPRQVLDLWKADAPAPTPLVFYIHGGGWMPFPRDKGVVVTHQIFGYRTQHDFLIDRLKR
ncbi:MAG: hypothetical protein RBS80_31415 [Thermoguttaceae bacterium]|jgi:acetyl esterase/lipase|nr:hypothetical protein [Thermoguttaceae bacterium]